MLDLYRQELAESIKLWKDKYSPDLEVIREMTKEFSTNDFDHIRNEFLADSL
jgi:hypothetical protein